MVLEEAHQILLCVNGKKEDAPWFLEDNLQW